MSKTKHVRLFNIYASPYGQADADEIVEMDNETATELIDSNQAEEIDIKGIKTKKPFKSLVKPSKKEAEVIDKRTKKVSHRNLVRVSGDPDDKPAALDRSPEDEDEQSTDKVE